MARNGGWGNGAHTFLTRPETGWNGSSNSVKDALEAADALWTPVLEPSRFTFMPGDGEILLDTDVVLPNGEVLRFGDGYNVTRSDNHQAIGKVGSRYRPFSNLECFGALDDPLFKDRVEIVGVGAYKGGREVFVQACLVGQDEVADGDVQERTVFVRTSHNGTKNLEMFIVSIRLYCTNQLPMAMKNGGQGFAVPHVESGAKMIGQLAHHLDVANTVFDVYTAKARQLAKRSMSKAEWEQYLDLLVPVPNIPRNKNEEENIAVRRAKDTRLAMTTRFLNPDLPSCNGTLWGAVNAVTGYYDHDHEVFGTKTLTESAAAGLRIKKLSLDGSEAEHKHRAYTLALGRL